MNPEQARAWCLELAARLPHQHIDRGDAPYLTRYFAAGWDPYKRGPGPSIFLHHFHASDPGVSVHSHPWGWGCSLILWGGYTEFRCGAGNIETERAFRPGDVNILMPDDKHRVVLLESDCWTLFLAGNYAQPWNFFESCS